MDKENLNEQTQPSKFNYYKKIFKNKKINELINKGFVIHQPQKLQKKKSKHEPEHEIPNEKSYQRIDKTKEKVRIYEHVNEQPRSTRAVSEKETFGELGFYSKSQKWTRA